MKKKMKEIPAGGSLALKIMSFHILSGITVIGQIAVIWLSAGGGFFPSEEALMSIVSSFAEIIAGLYGITMASYTFFLSRMDALMASDVTLDYIVDSMKRRFKYLIWFITANVLLVLGTTMLLMYFPAPQTEYLFFYRLFCNEFILSVVTSVGLILYYAILVINPNSIEKEAARLKKRLSPATGPVGDPVAFIALYDRMEAACNRMIPPGVLGQIHENKGRRFEYTLNLLQKTRPELKSLLADLNRIHRYYECVVNCKTLTVTQNMCLLAANALRRLEEIQ